MRDNGYRFFIFAITFYGLVGSKVYGQSSDFIEIANRHIGEERQLRVVSASPSNNYAIVEVTYNLEEVDPLAELAPDKIQGIKQYYLVSKGLETIRPITNRSYIAGRGIEMTPGCGGAEGCSGPGEIPVLKETRIDIDASRYHFSTDAYGRELLVNSSKIDFKYRRVRIRDGNVLAVSEKYLHPATTMCSVYHFTTLEEATGRTDLGDLTPTAKQKLAAENGVFYHVDREARRIFPILGPEDYVSGMEVPVGSDCREYDANGGLNPVVFQATSEHANLFPVSNTRFQNIEETSTFTSAVWNNDLQRGYNVLLVEWRRGGSEVAFSALRRNQPTNILNIRGLEDGTIRAEKAYVFKVQPDEEIARVKRHTSRVGGPRSDFYEVVTTNRNVYYFKLEGFMLLYNSDLEVQQSKSKAERTIVISQARN